MSIVGGIGRSLRYLRLSSIHERILSEKILRSCYLRFPSFKIVTTNVFIHICLSPATIGNREFEV